MKQPFPHAGRKLAVPHDGVVLSNRPKSWLGIAWNSILTSLGKQHGNRLAKGRGLARAGRVRDLWFSPGLVHAEVHDDECFQVSLRVEVLQENDWKTIVTLLSKHLHLVASLLEGSLSSQLLKLLDTHNLQLMPRANEIHGDCNCSDYHTLCPHMAAVHLILADALDGDPFLLLNLRGRNQQQLLSALRRKWGDTKPYQREALEPTEPAPPTTESWYVTPHPDAYAMRFTIRKPAEPTLIGLKALGPPPGKADLHTALKPIYRSGSMAAETLALTEKPNKVIQKDRLKNALKNLGSSTTDELARILDEPEDRMLEYLMILEEEGFLSHRLSKTQHLWTLQ